MDNPSRTPLDKAVGDMARKQRTSGITGSSGAGGTDFHGFDCGYAYRDGRGYMYDTDGIFDNEWINDPVGAGTDPDASSLVSGDSDDFLFPEGIWLAHWEFDLILINPNDVDRDIVYWTVPPRRKIVHGFRYDVGEPIRFEDTMDFHQLVVGGQIYLPIIYVNLSNALDPYPEAPYIYDAGANGRAALEFRVHVHRIADIVP